MESTLLPLRLGRSGGTTDVDLRVCARFVSGRPGWAVIEVIVARGDTGIDLRTSPDDGPTGCWHIRRMAGRLTALDAASRTRFHDVATMRELLGLIGEVEAGFGVAA